MPRKAGKVKDKWREKAWVLVEAPPYFGSTQIAKIPITDPGHAIGRVIETTLYDMTKQDPRHYGIKLYFVISKIEDGKATTTFKGHEYSRDYLRSLVRRGSSMVSFIHDYTTKDGMNVRTYVVMFVHSRINSSRKHALRLITHKILTEKTASLTYDQYAQEAVLEKTASDIQHEARKIVTLRHIGIRKTKLLSVPSTFVEKPSEVEEVQESPGKEEAKDKEAEADEVSPSPPLPQS